MPGERGNTEIVEAFRAQALAVSATFREAARFPLGEGWRKLIMRFQTVLTLGTGSGAVAEGELQIIKGVKLTTDKGENICDNVPGRLLHRLNQIMLGTAPVKDAIAATTGTYNVPLEIYFSDEMKGMINPDDTLLDTSRYNKVQLDFQIGSVSDLLTTVGTASITATLDCAIQRVMGRLPADASPNLYVEYGILPPQVPTTQTYIDLPRSADLTLKRALLYATNGSTAGVPMSGTADNTVVSDASLQADNIYPINKLLADMVQREAQGYYMLETIPAGCHFLDFIRDKSLRRALWTGDKALLRVSWSNGSSLPGTPQVSLGYQGVRPLKG